MQRGDAFSLLSTSSNAIPVNLPYIVDCAAFPGGKTSLSEWLDKVGIDRPSSCKGKMEIQR